MVHISHQFNLQYIVIAIQASCLYGKSSTSSHKLQLLMWNMMKYAYHREVCHVVQFKINCYYPMAMFIISHRITSTPHPMAFTGVDIIIFRIQLIKVYLFVGHANNFFTQQLIHLPVQTYIMHMYILLSIFKSVQYVI